MEPDPLRRDLKALHPAGFGWAMACTRGDRQEAEAVLQTSYLRILQGKARFDGRSSFRTFLFGVIRIVAAGRRRRRLLEGLFLERYGDTLRTAGEGGGGNEPDGAEALAVRQALSSLPRRQREVLHLVFYEGLTIQEAARIMGVGLGSARTHYERGKRGLRERLTEGAGAHE